MTNVHVPPASGQILDSSLSAAEPSGEVADLPPQFAMRTDGVVLLCTTEAVAFGRDLTGRKMWVAIELTLDEIALLRGEAYDAEQTAAARITGSLPKKQTDA